MKELFYLFIFLSVCPLIMDAQDIDFPLSQSEIEKYESRVHIQRLPDVAITHPDAYKIRTQKPVYSPSTKQITLDVINVDAPAAEPEYHWMKATYRRNRLVPAEKFLGATMNSVIKRSMKSLIRNPFICHFRNSHFGNGCFATANIAYFSVKQLSGLS